MPKQITEDNNIELRIISNISPIQNINYVLKTLINL
jgi:hypothetical protein